MFPLVQLTEKNKLFHNRPVGDIHGAESMGILPSPSNLTLGAQFSNTEIVLHFLKGEIMGLLILIWIFKNYLLQRWILTRKSY